MIKTLIVSHGELAEALLAAAETIAGRNASVAAVSLAWDDTPEQAAERIGTAIERLGPHEQGLLILTDMIGGTPYNVAIGFREPGRVEVVAGVNLPMVLRLECMREDERSVTEMARWITAKGRRSIGGAPAGAEPGG